MTNTPEVNWAEGMFLRPQHLQLSSRHFTSLIGGAVRGKIKVAYHEVIAHVRQFQCDRLSDAPACTGDYCNISIRHIHPLLF